MLMRIQKPGQTRKAQHSRHRENGARQSTLLYVIDTAALTRRGFGADRCCVKGVVLRAHLKEVAVSTDTVRHVNALLG